MFKLKKLYQSLISHSVLKKLNRNFLLDISTNIGSDEIKAKADNQKPKFIQNSITF